MKKAVTLILLLAATCVIYFGCKKASFTDINNAATNQVNVIGKQIAEAKAFFETHTDTNAVQKFKKRALWDRAYIAHYKSGDKVCVPLVYDKKYTFMNKFSHLKSLY